MSDFQGRGCPVCAHLRSLSAVSLAGLLLVLSGCNRQQSGPPPRYAVLRFENLTGDASLDWTGRAASEVLSRMLATEMSGPVLHGAALERTSAALGPDPGAAPGISAETAGARLAGATRVISGYIEKAGPQIRIGAYECDLATQSTIRFVEGRGASPLAAMNALAKAFSPNALPYLTTSTQALRSYAIGMESRSAADLEQAIAADPNFGPAWAALVGLEVARGDRDAAKQTIARAARYHLDAYDQAAIDAENANLNNNRHARVDALRRISALSPGDTALLQTVAAAEMDAGEFADAAMAWNKLAAVLPDDANAWNLLGYARAYSGDYQGAISAIREYQRLDPSSANPIDSLGDIQFLFRKYNEAAATYIAANNKDPQFLNHGELYKAAWAKFHAGDKSGADSLFTQFRFARDKAHDAMTPLFVADWLYRTGHSADAMAMLRGEADKAGPAIQPLAYAQLAIWDLLAGDRPAAAADAQAAGAPASAPVFLAKFCALPTASAEEWNARAEKTVQGDNGSTLRLLAVGYALILDDKPADAIPIWEQIVDRSSGTDFFVRDVLARLQDQPVKQAIVPNPSTVNQFAAVLDRL